MPSQLKKLFASTLLCVAMFWLPVCAEALNYGSLPSGGYVSSATIVNGLINFFWPIIVGFTIVMFVVAGFHFFTAQGNPEKIAQANRFVIFGFAGVIVILIAFSIVLVTRNLVGV